MWSEISHRMLTERKLYDVINEFDHQPVSWYPFVFIVFPLLFYSMIVVISYNRLRPRFPFFLVLLAISFPPLFFAILLYIFCAFILITTPLEIQEAQRETQVDMRRRRVSRQDIRDRV